MKRIAVFSCLLLALATGCKKGKEEILIRSWRAIRMENAENDNFFTQSKIYIDTIGNNGNDEVNLRLYGSTNMDSVRREMLLQYDSARAIQMQAVNNTVFNFKKDSVVVFYLSGRIDTGKWYLDGENALTVEEKTEDGSVEKVKWDLLTLTDTALKLVMHDGEASTTVTFHPEGK